MKSEIKCPICSANSCMHIDYELGYADLIGEVESFYWGEVKQSDARLINERAKESGWKTAIEEFFRDDPKMFDYLLSPIRIDWFFWIYSRNIHKVMDIGSGWGTLAFSLSELVDEVWSVETVKERMEFQAIRKKQECRNNIHLVRSWNYPLPFPDNSFDLVVVNGVLEWIGLIGDEDPRTIQKKFLSEIRRILKPEGIIYLGIENRWGIQYFLGFPDHTDIRFTSLMPRRIADLVVQWRSVKNPIAFLKGAGKGYRTYTYGHRGYHTLLTEAGFTSVKTFWTIPDYSRTFFSGDIRSSKGIRHLCYDILLNKEMETKRFALLMTFIKSRLGRSIVNLFLKMNLPQLIMPAFLIFASESSDPVSGSIVDKIVSDTTDVLRISSSNVVFLNLGNGTSYKINRFPWEKEKVEREIVNPTLKGSVVEYEGKSVYCSPVVSGRRLNDDELHRAGLWLRDFQKGREKGHWGMNEYARCKDQNVFEAYSLMGMSCEKIIERIFMNMPMKKVPAHGDFTLDNIFLDNDGDVRVIDWEHYNEEGDQWFDLTTLILGVLFKRKKLSFDAFIISPRLKKLLLVFDDTAPEKVLTRVLHYIPMAMATIIDQEMHWQAGKFNRDFMARILSRSEEYKKSRFYPY